MKHRPISLFALATIISFSGNLTAQETLQWRFRTGESLKYNVVQNMKTTMTVGGKDIPQSMNQAMEMSWNILQPDAPNMSKMEQVVNRIRMKMEGPGGAVEFDTQDGKKPENPVIATLGETLQKIVNQPFTVSMAPTGKITNVSVPKGLLEAMQAGAAGNAAAMNEETLQQMMKQSSVTFPTEAVGPNSKWNSSQSVEFAFGTMNINSTMTYAQKDSQGNAVINVQPEISVTPKASAPIKMQLKNSEGRGQITFDVARGRVLKSRLDLTLEMKVEAANGQVFDQKINQTTAMTLAP